MTVSCLIRGVHYPSISAAARTLGISVSAIHGALERGTADNCGLGIQPSTPITCDGTLYPSISAFARAFGMSSSTLSRHLTNKGGTHRLKDGRVLKKVSP
jgi:AraC-like DNA-binding protein